MTARLVKVFRVVERSTTYCADVPDGAMCMAVGPMADVDDCITAIDFESCEYTTIRRGLRPFPAKWYDPDSLNWVTHRVELTLVPGHEEHHR